MPFFAPPHPHVPMDRDSRRPHPPSGSRRGDRDRSRGRLLGAAALCLLMLTVAAGFGLFAASKGLPANPVPGGSVGNRQATVVAPAQGGNIAAPVLAEATAPGVCLSGNRDSFGSSVTIGGGEWVCGNVSVYGGSATILGHVNGNVTVIGGSADVAGQVDGNVTTIGGSIILRSSASVGGNVDAVGGSISRNSGATVGGNVEQGLAGHGDGATHWLGLFSGASFPWFHVLFWALAGLVVAAFFPAPLRRVRDVARREPALSFVGGLATLFFGVIVGLVLFITCLGIPLLLLLALGMWLAWIVGTVALGYWLGEGLLHLGAARDRSPVVAAVLGVTLLSLFESVPCLGGVVSFVAGCIGLGASALAILYSRRAAAWRSRMV